MRPSVAVDRGPPSPIRKTGAPDLDSPLKSFSPAELSLRDLYLAETAELRRRFESSGDGRTAVVARSALVDAVVAHLYAELVPAERHAQEVFAWPRWADMAAAPCSPILTWTCSSSP